MNARWYDPQIGRFVSADTIVPQANNPQAYNRYSYGYNNPIRYTDPSGHCGADTGANGVNSLLTEQCVILRDELENLYDIKISGEWMYKEMALFRGAIQSILQALSDDSDEALALFQDIWGGTKFERVRDTWGATAWTKSRNKIELHDGTFYQPDLVTETFTAGDRSPESAYETVAHEMAHIWDRRSGRDLSSGLRDVVGGEYEHRFLWLEYGEYSVTVISAWTWGGDASHPPNEGEDWAYTFAAFVVDSSKLAQPRTDFVEEQLELLR